MTNFVSPDPLNNLTNTYQRPIFINAARTPRDIRTFPTSADIQPSGTQWQANLATTSYGGVIYETSGGGVWTISGGEQAIETINTISPTTTGNFTISGNANMNISGTTNGIILNPYNCASIIVDPTPGKGNYTTIGAALAAATSGKTIFIRPGTYTENLTLVPGVNLTAFDCDAFTPNVTINGKITLSGAGTVSISGIALQTNSDFCIVVSGTAASILNLYNCNIMCLNNTGVSYTCSNAASSLNIFNADINTATTGIGVYSMTSAGGLFIFNCFAANSGASTTANSNSNGVVTILYSQFGTPFATSSTGEIVFLYNLFSTQNVTGITTAGSSTGNQVSFNLISTGSASAISAGTGTSILMEGNGIDSSNTNAITGIGTVKLGMNSFSTSKIINTTTVTPLGFYPGNIIGTAGNTVFATDSSSNITLGAANTNTLAINNVTQNTVGTVSKYMNVTVNGTAYVIPLYLLS